MQWIVLFLRAHAAAAVGTLADLALFALLVRGLTVAPVTAVVASATLGALINFLLARHWVFRAGDGALLAQAALFALGALGSIALNAGGVLLTVSEWGWPPLVGRVVTVLAVAACFNFPFQRFVVFRGGASS